MRHNQHFCHEATQDELRRLIFQSSGVAYFCKKVDTYVWFDWLTKSDGFDKFSREETAASPAVFIPGSLRILRATQTLSHTMYLMDYLNTDTI